VYFAGVRKEDNVGATMSGAIWENLRMHCMSVPAAG
jgi:hypothetical protein